MTASSSTALTLSATKTIPSLTTSSSLTKSSLRLRTSRLLEWLRHRWDVAIVVFILILLQRRRIWSLLSRTFAPLLKSWRTPKLMSKRGEEVVDQIFSEFLSDGEQSLFREEAQPFWRENYPQALRLHLEGEAWPSRVGRCEFVQFWRRVVMMGSQEEEVFERLETMRAFIRSMRLFKERSPVVSCPVTGMRGIQVSL